MDKYNSQPETEVVINKSEFNRIKQTVTYMRLGKKRKGNEASLPIDLGLFLTGKCNLRCKHCFEWNDTGFLNKSDEKYANNEMPIEDIKRCLEYTKPAKTRLYLWGGEPLLYSKFSELCKLLMDDPRWVTLCTNGLMNDKKLDDIISISENLVLLTSLDGFEENHDSIRGKGTYQKTLASIKKIIKLSKEGVYKGKQSVNCVISNEIIGKLYNFCELMEEIQIDSLYICFPWYISEITACKMDNYVKEKFKDTIKIKDISNSSWHNFNYHLDEALIENLKKDIKKIIGRKWKIRIRFQPALELDEMDDFINGGTKCAQKKTRCLANVNRLDVLQNGEVSACKLFKEFTVGNLRHSDIKDIWEGEKMNEIRKKMSDGLMPVCSKCILLYLNGI